ncbi:hypothetical protein PSCICJ_35370 [Pseudomonas cichorii]|uniref:hypothetical protein n=1 Tax=Pseudomonas cichorii TaxID=36746 RepID=UPI0019111D2F|nr:hypothetical protein [Pseudomonas cichorii]GFM67419.1 hypothetical protein PSCICJ_35370 [Pseudomonas cichorii]
MKWFARALFFLAAGFGSAAYGAVDVAAARQSLKDYGLANCIVKQFPDESDVKSDIKLAIGAYGFMGGGMHTVLQNEDTLETLHNPYKATMDYVFSAYDKVSAGSKYSKKKMVLYACLKVYNSKEFDEFIKSQDKYIQK